MKKLIVWIIVLAAAGGGYYWAYQKYPDKVAFWKAAKAADATKSTRPTTAVVTPRNINFAVTAAGDIGPVDTVSVRPEVSGRILKLNVDLGDKVKAGDVFFTLDDSDLQIERGSRLTEIEGSKLAIQTQKIQLEKATLAFNRTKELFQNKLVSQEVFDNARIDMELTANSLEISKNRLEVSQKNLQQVEDKLSKTIIKAPFDCTILTRPVSVGQAVSGSGGVNSGTEVLTVANLTEMIISAHINQSDVTRLTVGQAVDVEIEAIAGLKLVGHVDRIAPQATIKNGIKGFSTRIILRNAENVARPGMTANLNIPLVSADNVLAVPLAAVFTEQSDRFVYVKKGADKWERTPILVGVADYDFAEITKGLQGGETVSLVQPAGDTSLAMQAFDQKGGGKKGGKGGKTGKGGKGGTGGGGGGATPTGGGGEGGKSGGGRPSGSP
jgi:RND family efflux transporter MFP subunit